MSWTKLFQHKTLSDIQISSSLSISLQPTRTSAMRFSLGLEALALPHAQRRRGQGQSPNSALGLLCVLAPFVSFNFSSIGKVFSAPLRASTRRRPTNYIV